MLTSLAARIESAHDVAVSNGACCRFCGAALAQSFCDLGASPLANRYLTPEDLGRMEPTYPLHAFVCTACFLVQLEAFEPPERIFGDYAYFSSYSKSWLEHCRSHAEKTSQRLGLDAQSLVVEVASNDGYLLQYFRDLAIPVLGIEPARNIAEVARSNGISTLVRYFGTELAHELVEQGRKADLIVANNVIAHVPELNDFVMGLSLLLKQHGVISIEFPHLQSLIERVQFDTIYHEHFSYFSFTTLERIFSLHGLRIFDVDVLATHGGSLRIWVCHREASHSESPSLARMRAQEGAAGLGGIEIYRGFERKVRTIKRQLLKFLIQAKGEGKHVVGYGAAAKGNTLLNYCGVRTDFLDYVVDLNPYKQGRWLPGTRIPIVAPDRLATTKPDYLLILPWNIKDEIMTQIAYVRGWGGKFAIPAPMLEIVP
jgi:2-polyprenyl-3-methyl-5-hydroxy-6-metoxy-1,4-benzoquinol methylase